MKTYTKTEVITKPMLRIVHDDCPSSPRKWDNLGYFFTNQRHNVSPDGNDHSIYTIMIETGDEAENISDHIKLMKKRINKELPEEKVLAIYPVNKHEHGSVVYRMGTKKGFDYSNCGFYIVTKRTQAVLGTPKSKFEKVIEQELDMYTQYCNGEVYGYNLYSENGDLEGSCWGFYNIEDIKQDLPKEWENENMEDYFIN